MEMNVTIQPSSHRRPEETDQRNGEKVNHSEPAKDSTALQRRKKAKYNEQDAQEDADAESQFPQPTQEIQATPQNQPPTHPHTQTPTPPSQLPTHASAA